MIYFLVLPNQSALLQLPKIMSNYIRTNPDMRTINFVKFTQQT